MMRKILPLFIIVIGVALVLYPTAKDRYESYQQQEILEQWEDNLQQIEAVVSEPLLVENAIDSPAPSENPEVTGNAAETPEAESEYAEQLKAEEVEKAALAVKVSKEAYMKKHVEGVLTIAAIDLKLPILTNATQKNLALSLASIKNTGKAGVVGNYAIAGHRNYAYGKNFNRLDEVKVGDVIGVNTGTKQYQYIVTEKLYVLPTDVEVLRGNGVDREITLITCHPMKNPTKRLIVKGEILDSTL